MLSTCGEPAQPEGQKWEHKESRACHAGFAGHLVDLHVPRVFPNHCHFVINSLIAMICVWVEEVFPSE